MVSQLLDPRQPKNLSDLAVITILALHILAAYMLPAAWKKPVFALIFLFWRSCYNVGIGVLLHIQSNYNRLVTWAIRWKLFENPKSGKNPRPWLYNLLKTELEAKIPEDYDFEKAPIEYNTWLVFRRVVDLILMCDFVSYCLFAIVCGHTPEAENADKQEPAQNEHVPVLRSQDIAKSGSQTVPDHEVPPYFQPM